MNPNTIKHSGIVVDSSSGEVIVRIETRGACSSCNAKKLCSMGESQEKLIAVATPAVERFRSGDRVEVSVRQEMGIKAVMIAYVFPFLLVLAALLTMLQSGVGELTAGLVSLGALGFYYLILFSLRNRIAREIVFEIHPTEEISNE